MLPDFDLRANNDYDLKVIFSRFRSLYVSLDAVCLRSAIKPVYRSKNPIFLPFTGRETAQLHA